jgi:gliding motility-associated-like protein
MKSGFILRPLPLLLLLFSLYFVEAYAFTFTSDTKQDFNTKLAFTDNPKAKLIPPVIDLTVVPGLSKFALINWTSSPAPSQGTYHIERQAPSSSWVEIKQLPFNAQTVYTDTISFPYCTSTNFSYRIRFTSPLGTDDAVSLTKNVTLSDLSSPHDVPNVIVSLLQPKDGFNPRLSWDRITDDEISGYIIQRYNGFNWDKISTAPADSSGFTDNVPNNCNTSFKYVVRSVDKCGNESGDQLFEDIYVQTIKLEVQQPGACDKVAKLSWNSYHAMPGGLYGYNVYRSDPLGAPMQFETKDTTYNDKSNFVKGHIYFYSVTALSKNNIDTSTSCQASWKSNLDVSPEVYITQASVEANSFVRVSYHITPPSRVIKLILERSDNGTTNFQPIDSLLAVLDSYVPEDQFIDDTSARVQTQSYYYRLVAYDDCNKTKSYNTARSILLQGFTDQTKNTLNWNSYETWNLGVERYTIYRILDEDPATIEMLGTTDPSRVSFVDLLSGVDPTKAVCYWVVANEISSQATSQSNTFCISKEPLLFMPNAFYPDGINHLLRPVPKPAFVDLQSFKMTVFNRWGQQLFETTDITMGWDGVINGQNAPAGLYTYLLNYKSLEGKEYTKRGTAALLR